MMKKIYFLLLLIARSAHTTDILYRTFDNLHETTKKYVLLGLSTAICKSPETIASHITGDNSIREDICKDRLEVILNDRLGLGLQTLATAFNAPEENFESFFCDERLSSMAQHANNPEWSLDKQMLYWSLSAHAIDLHAQAHEIACLPTQSTHREKSLASFLADTLHQPNMSNSSQMTRNRFKDKIIFKEPARPHNNMLIIEIDIAELQRFLAATGLRDSQS